MGGQLFGDGFRKVRAEMPEKGMPPRMEQAHEAVADQNEAGEFEQSFENEFVVHETCDAGCGTCSQGAVSPCEAKLRRQLRSQVQLGNEERGKRVDIATRLQHKSINLGLAKTRSVDRGPRW